LILELNDLTQNLQSTDTLFAFPNIFDCFFILISIGIFVTGIVGNLLVVLVVIKNSHMKTVTNMFIVNLAIGDILVILICLPPTIVTDITRTWYFGKTMCKIIPYIQVANNLVF
jgi:hypocretin (orexin) receptor 2